MELIWLEDYLALSETLNFPRAAQARHAALDGPRRRRRGMAARTLAEEDISAGLLVEAGNPELAISIEIRLFRPVARQSLAAQSVWAAFERT